MSQPASTLDNAGNAILPEQDPTIVGGLSSSSQSVNVIDSVDVEIEGFEILDSEDGSDSEDPFRALVRSRTEPLVSTTRCAGDGNRLSTAPSRVRTKKQKVELLEVLLPENYNITGLDMESTVIQYSREQSGDMCSRGDSNANWNQRTPDVIYSDDILITSTRRTEPTRRLLQSEHREANKAIENVGAIELPSSSVERLASSQMTGTFPVNTILSSDERCEEPGRPHSVTLIKESVESQNINETCSNIDEQPMSESPTETKTHDTESSNNILVTEVVIPSRSRKRKANLSDLCSRKAKLPYRVGLSKRANVEHLHSYLSKKRTN